MYQEFYGLKEQPFSLTPNTQFYLNSETHRQAFETLMVALANHEGFIEIVGEVGTGKTLLCRKLLNALGEDYVTAYVPNPALTPEGLYQAVAEELGVEIEAELGSHRLLKSLNEKLIRNAAGNLRTVLVIDEAQSMSVQALEALRLLSNLETESAKLIQIVLFGQPELDDMLAESQLRQLKQRITFKQKLAPLDQGATAHYVSHRLAQAGYNGPALFDRRALKTLYKASGGIPRIVNILSHKALMVAFGKGDRVIGRKHVKAAVQDTESARPVGWLMLSLPLVGVFALMLSGVVYTGLNL